jgi:hypothetical protein
MDQQQKDERGSGPATPAGGVLAWHFLPADRCLRYGDGRVVEAGRAYETLFPYRYGRRTYDLPTLCEAGMHGSVRALDALQYAGGAVVCRVVVSGDVAHGDDKIVGRRRTVLAMADATMVLHAFACDQAEEALRRYDPNPDPRSLAAIETKRRWMRGEATDEELAAARAAARAAGAAAWDAARDAANVALEDMLFDLLGITRETGAAWEVPS